MSDLPYVIVPRVATEEMCGYAQHRNPEVSKGLARGVFFNMVEEARPPVSLEEIVEVLETALVWMPIGFAPTLGIAPADTHNARAGVARERVRSLLSRLTSMGETK